MQFKRQAGGRVSRTGTRAPAEPLPASIGGPSPTGGDSVTGPPVADSLAVVVCPPHADLGQPGQPSRCRPSTCGAGWRRRPVELVGNLKGFPRIHRPGVVLAGTGETAEQLPVGTGAPRPRAATTSAVSQSPTGSASSSVRHTATGLAPADVSLAALHTRCRAAVAACGLVGNLKGFPQIHRPCVFLAVAGGGPLVAGAQHQSQIHHLFKSMKSRQSTAATGVVLPPARGGPLVAGAQHRRQIHHLFKSMKSRQTTAVTGVVLAPARGGPLVAGAQHRSQIHHLFKSMKSRQTTAVTGRRLQPPDPDPYPSFGAAPGCGSRG